MLILYPVSYGECKNKEWGKQKNFICTTALPLVDRPL